MPVTITAFVTAGSPGTVTPGTPNELITGNNAGELAPVETISFYDGSPLVGNLLNAEQAYFAGDAIGGAPSGYNISPTQNIGKIDSTYSNTSLCANSLMVTCKINGLITITSQPKTPILPGTPYVILADIYTPAVRSGATATIGCNFYDSSGNIISGSYSSSPFTLVAASWNYLSYICLSTPANAYEAVITVLIPSATTSDSSYWIDCLL